MSNKLHSLLLALALIGAACGRAYADQAVSKIFHQLDTEALRQWHQKPITHEKQGKKQAIKSGKILQSHVHDLSPEQLVELIKQCKQKIQEVPSDSKHERYFDYFEQAIAFSIARLGEQKTTAAKEALDKVKPIIAGGAHLEQVWDQAKAKQTK